MNQPDFCNHCEDRGTPDCALPTIGNKLGRVSLQVLGGTVESLVHFSASIRGIQLENDTLGLIKRTGDLRDELYVPAEACTYLHEGHEGGQTS